MHKENGEVNAVKLQYLVLLVFLFCLPTWAQRTFYATGLTWNDEVSAYLGLVNPSSEEVSFTLLAPASGDSRDQVVMSLPAYGRLEFATADLFESAPAWLEIESPIFLAGYVRLVNAAGSSDLLPLSPKGSNSLWLSALPEDGADTRFSLVNTTESDSTASMTLKRNALQTFNTQHLSPVLDVTGFGAAMMAIDMLFTDVSKEGNQGLLWARFDSELPLLGVQRFSNGADLAAIPLPGESSRSLFLTHPTAQSGFVSGLELTNTTDRVHEVTLTVYDTYLEPLSHDLTLEPGEKRTITFGDKQQLPQFMPTWYQLRNNETGVVAHRFTRRVNGEGISFDTTNFDPASGVVLPALTGDMEVTLVNPFDENAIYLLYGYDDGGSLVSFKRLPIFAPYQKACYRVTDLFGNDAANISWARVLCSRGKVIASSFDTSAGVSSMGAIPYLFYNDERVVADFEQVSAKELGYQGWSGQMFADDFARIDYANFGHLYESDELPPLGNFFFESDFIAAHGHNYLGYEPMQPSDQIKPNRRDAVALVSPPTTVPEYASCYLTFDLRFINPERASSGSRYGIAWRIEDSDDWQWFGVDGDLLLDPPLLLSDCWERTCYRNNHTEVTLTPWFTFQALLPEYVRGQRIQVGLFYDQVHSSGKSYQGPIVFVDHVRIGTKAIDHPFFYERASGAIANDND